MKRILSILLFAVMILTTAFVPVQASSTSDVVISGTEITATPGETVKIPIMIEQNKGFCGLNLYFTFSDKLTFVSLTNTVDSLVCTHSITTVWDSATDYTGTGLLAVLEFVVPENVENGTEYTININFIEAYDENLKDVSCSATSGKIIVVDGEDDNSPIIGDIDGDGKINAKDANLLRRIVSGAISPTYEQTLSSDINEDGAINSIDANLITRIVAGT